LKLGIGDWGLGIGDWGLGPIPNPQSPIPILIFFEKIKFTLQMKYSIFKYYNFYFKYDQFNAFLNMIYKLINKTI